MSDEPTRPDTPDRSEAVKLEVRRIGRELKGDYNDAEPDDLLADDRFLAAVALLEDPAVSEGTIAQLSLSNQVFVTAVGLEAIARRRSASDAWAKRAVRRLGPAGVGETRFLLRALSAAAPGPIVAEVLAQVESGWGAWGLFESVAACIEARLAGGEAVTEADLARHLSADDEPAVEAVLRAFPGQVPAELDAAVTTWRRSLVDLDFFRPFAQILEPESGSAELVAGREAVVRSVVDAVRTRRSILLVGEQGVGKTVLVREALARLAAEGWVAFRAGAADVHGGAAYSGELETRVQEIVQRTDGRQLVWHFPGFEDSLWAGQHKQSARGLLDALLPALETGRAVIVGEIEPSAAELLTRQRPRVGAHLDSIRVEPLAEPEALTVARAELAATPGPSAADGTLSETLDLATHYLPGTASPGNLLRLVKLARARAAERGSADVEIEDVLGGLQAATGLPLDILDHRTPLELGTVRRIFAERVLGQPEAVDCLVERMAMIKAGLTDPTRPLGVFLFVGPTGTGKTELAKTLAHYLFGSEERLVRIDMTEYQTWDSVERLLADSTVHHHAAPLVSSVRQRPFSVVLLDEFEKANRAVWDLFLQVFDDGRLTDQSGRIVDFRHCVIILTSNVGSAIPGVPGPGFVAGASAPTAGGIERAIGREFRPELLNRLDRVVAFRPLGREVMRRLLEHELASVLGRRGFRVHPWAVEWDAGAVDLLLAKGFSAELGARPLKRAVERYLLAPLATAIVERQVPEGDQFLFITAVGDRLGVSFVDPDADDTETPHVEPSDRPVAALVTDPRGGEAALELLRRESERLRPLVAAWSASKAEALAETREAAFWEREDRAETLAFVEYVDRLETAWRTGERLAARLTGSTGSPAADALRLLAERLYLLDRALDGLEERRVADAFLRIAPAAGPADEAALAFAGELSTMYERWARARGMRFERLASVDSVLTAAVSGLAAFTILDGESGLHVLETPQGPHHFDRAVVRVTVAPRSFAVAGDGSLGPAAEAALASVAQDQTVVRRYRREPSPLVRDAVRGWRTGRIDRVLAGDFDVIA